MTSIGADLLVPAAASERAIVITRLLNAPRELVWTAWTDPLHVAAWWGPEGFETTSCEIDLRIGGRFRLVMRAPDGSECPCSGVFREIVRPERLVYDGAPEARHACGAGLPPGATVTVLFEEQDGGTLLTIDTRFATEAARQAAADAGLVSGWQESNERLAALLRQLRP